VVLCLFLVAAAVGATAYLVSSTLGGLNDRVESSWGLRGQSLLTALTPNSDLVEFLFGVGPRQSTDILRKLLAGVPLAKEQDDVAVWSVTMCQYMETGVLGGLGMLLVLAMILRAVSRSSAQVLGLASVAVWAAGITVATSYPHLPPVWLFLGVLLEWDRVFPSAVQPAERSPRQRPAKEVLDSSRRDAPRIPL
jgi:hypothetical protein